MSIFQNKDFITIGALGKIPTHTCMILENTWTCFMLMPQFMSVSPCTLTW